MIFVREASVAVVLVTLTLSLQCAGMAAVIAWARPSFVPDVRRLGPIRSAILVMRLMTAFIGLHVLEILLWAAFFRWLCFPLWESAFYFSTSSYATVGYGDIVLPQIWGDLGSSGKHHRCADVWLIGELSFHRGEQAGRS